MTKRKPTNEQVKRIARLYTIGKADLTKRERIGKLLFFFLEVADVSNIGFSHYQEVAPLTNGLTMAGLRGE